MEVAQVVYRSLSEIFEALDETRETIYRRVEDLGPEQYRYQEESGRWSVAGVIEHISGAEARILSRFRDLIGQAETAGKPGPAGPYFRPISVEEIRARSAATQFRAPEAFEPKGELTLDELLERIRTTRKELLTLRPKFEALNLSETKFPHPAFGPLDLYEWLAFIVVHESRHLSQIDRILSCPGFPGAKPSELERT
jgi:uncharacterized damage-inducible protein DinB